MKSFNRLKSNIKRIATAGAVSSLLLLGSVSALDVSVNSGGNYDNSSKIIYANNSILNINITLNNTDNNLFSSYMYVGIIDLSDYRWLRDSFNFMINSTSSQVSDGTNSTSFSGNWMTNGYDYGQYADVSSLNNSKDWNVTLKINISGLTEGKEYKLVLDNNEGDLSDGYTGIKLIKDLTPPSLTIDFSDNVKKYEGDNNYYVNEDFNISYEVSDNVVNSSEIQVSYYNGTGWSSTSSNPIQITVGNGGLSEGNYTIKVKAVDKAGNENVTKAYSFVVDTTKPTATLNLVPSPITTITYDNKTYKLIDMNTFNITVNATDNNFLKAELFVNGESFKNYNSSVSSQTETLQNLSDGYYTIELKVYDKAGNENSSTLNVSIDTTNPEVLIKPNEDASYYIDENNKTIFYKENNILFDINASDNIMLKSINFTLENSNGNILNNLTSDDLLSLNSDVKNKPLNLSSLNLSNGDYVLKVEVKDKANHVITKTYNFTVNIDNVNPTLKVSNVRYEYNETNNKYYLAGNISYSDDNSGIKDVVLHYGNIENKSILSYTTGNTTNGTFVGSFKVPLPTLLGKVDNQNITIEAIDRAGNINKSILFNGTKVEISNMPDYVLRLNKGYNYVSLEGQYNVEAPLFTEVISDLRNEENVSIKAYELLNDQWIPRDLKEVIENTDTKRTKTEQTCVYYPYTYCYTTTVDNPNYNPLYNFLLGDVIKVETQNNEVIEIPIYYKKEQPSKEFYENLEANKWSAISFVDTKLGDNARVNTTAVGPEYGETAAYMSNERYEFNFIPALIQYNYFFREADSGKGIFTPTDIKEYKVYYILPKANIKIFSPFGPKLPQ